MKQNQYTGYTRLNSDFKKNQKRILKITIALPMFLLSFSTYAQFININIEIPTKTGQHEMVPLEMNLQTDMNNTLQILTGNSILNITGDENFQVQATLTSSDSLSDETGRKVPFKVDLAYRNDGVGELPGINAGRVANFPLSNCGRIMENRKDTSKALNAYLFINVTSGQIQNNNTTYVGDINLKIECN